MNCNGGSDVSERSLARLSEAHLHQLVEIARDDLDGFFLRNPQLSAYRSRVLLTALCQGAALHYLDHTNGVKDLDVWTFFAVLPDLRLQPCRPAARPQTLNVCFPPRAKRSCGRARCCKPGDRS